MKKLISIILCLILFSALGGCKFFTPAQDSYLSYEIEIENENSSQEASSKKSKPKTKKPATKKPASSNNAPKSTIGTPNLITYYKDGHAIHYTNANSNKKLAEFIESYYLSSTNAKSVNTTINKELIYKIKGADTAIEITFNSEVKLYGGIVPSGTQSILIPLTGNHANMLICGSNIENYQSAISYSPKDIKNSFPEIFKNPISSGTPEYVGITLPNNQSIGFKYSKFEAIDPSSKYEDNGKFVYYSTKNSFAKIDAKTFELLEVKITSEDKHIFADILNVDPSKKEQFISSFAKQMSDVSDYKEYFSSSNNDIFNYTLVRYTKYVGKYPTTQTVAVELDLKNHEFIYTKTPNSFDGLEKLNITDEKILKIYRTLNGPHKGYSVSELRLDHVYLTVKNDTIYAVVTVYSIYDSRQSVIKNVPLL